MRGLSCDTLQAPAASCGEVPEVRQDGVAWLCPRRPPGLAGIFYAVEGRMSDDVERVVVFMDYQNIHGWARRQFLPFGADPGDGHIFSPPRSVNSLLSAAVESELLEVRVYRGRPNPTRQPGARPPTTGRRTCGNVPTESPWSAVTFSTPTTTRHHEPRRKAST